MTYECIPELVVTVAAGCSSTAKDDKTTDKTRVGFSGPADPVVQLSMTLSDPEPQFHDIMRDFSMTFQDFP